MNYPFTIAEMKACLEGKFPDLKFDEKAHLILPDDQDILTAIARKYPDFGWILEDPVSKNLPTRFYPSITPGPLLMFMMRGQGQSRQRVSGRIRRAADAFKKDMGGY